MQFDNTKISADKSESSPMCPEARVEQGELADAETQAKYQAAFLEQLRRLSCPGCGDSEFVG